MEMKKGWGSFLSSIENDETKSLRFLAFCDFCRDLLEERFGEIPPHPSNSSQKNHDENSLEQLHLLFPSTISGSFKATRSPFLRSPAITNCPLVLLRT